MILRFGSAVLASLLLTQLFLIGTGARNSPLTGPLPGEKPPAVDVIELTSGSLMSLDRLLLQHGGCSLLVIVSTECGACEILRDEWQNRVAIWLDSVGSPIQSLWLSTQDRTRFTAFVEGANLEGVTLLSPQGAGSREMSQLGVIGTPLSYLIDEGGFVRLGVLGSRFPPVEATKEICL